MDLYRNILRTKHPDRKVLFHDPDYHWRWYPDLWPEPYRWYRRKVTGRDVAEVRAEIGRLRDELRAPAPSQPTAEPQPVNGGARPPGRPSTVYVPPRVRRNIRRRARHG